MDKKKVIDNIMCLLFTPVPSYVEAFGIGGSYATGCNDSFSDIDIFVLVKENELEIAIVDMPVIAKKISSPLLSKGPVKYWGYGFVFTYFYSDFLIQIMLNDRTTLDNSPARANTEIIYDPIGFYSEYTQKMKGVGWNYKAILEQACNYFGLRLLSIRKSLSRNNIWMSVSYLCDLRKELFVIERIVHNCDPVDFQFPEKNIEKDLINFGINDYSSTYPDFCVQSIYNCTLRLIEKFEILSGYIKSNKDIDEIFKGVFVSIFKFKTSDLNKNV